MMDTHHPVAFRRRAMPWLAAVALLIVPLSGCMSTGTSSFASVSQTEQTASIDATQPLPLDVASDSTAPIQAQPPIDGAAGDPAAGPVGSGQARLASLNAPATAGNGTGDLQALIQADDPRLAQPADQQFSSLTPNGRPTATPVMASMYRFDDPAELAAQARIPALYASIDHGQCKGGWGPKPKMINATRVTLGEPYYMEMRLRNTPMLPVGHVYIAYGRLGPDGQPLDEKLIMLAPLGGYGGAAVAAAIPMPGVMKPYGDDCIVRPHAAYRISLTAQRFEQLLLEIQKQKKKKPAYALFAYNCNHFMSDVAKSVGVLPPENIYEPSLKYFYSMMDRNEGRKVPRTVDELKREQMRYASNASTPFR